MLRRLYDRTMALADHRHAMWALAAIAFLESSVFPIPPDVLMIPMILARPSRAWAIAGVALAASVLGGLLGYAIGALAYESVGQPILAAMGKAEARDLGLDGGALYDPQTNYDRVKGAIFDWSSDPAPTARATRTVDTKAQDGSVKDK